MVKWTQAVSPALGPLVIVQPFTLSCTLHRLDDVLPELGQIPGLAVAAA